MMTDIITTIVVTVITEEYETQQKQRPNSTSTVVVVMTDCSAAGPMRFEKSVSVDPRSYLTPSTKASVCDVLLFLLFCHITFISSQQPFGV
jgi:hypothetical protein